MDLALSLGRSRASHDAACPEIGPICAQRDEPPQQHHTTLWLTELRLLAEYGLVPGVAVQAAVPFRIADSRTRYTDLAGRPVTLDYENIHHRNETLAAFGDPQLFVHAATRFGEAELGGRAGLSLPLGEVSENPYRLGDQGKPHQHIQFGTGTFDPLLGLDASVPAGRFRLAAFAFGQVPLYAGPRGYQAGARLFGGASASTPLGGAAVTARLGASVLGELAERWDGHVPHEDGNRGRTDVYISPGITVPFANDWSANLDVRVRAYGHVVGGQLELPVVIELGIGRLFHLESGEHEEHGESGGDVLDVVVEGEAVPLEPVAGKWTVFDFWAEWCEACRPLDRALRELATEHHDLAIRRVNIIDFDSPIAKQELPGVSTLPRLRLVAPSGAVVFEASGSAAELEARVAAELRGSEQEPEHGEHEHHEHDDHAH